MKRVLFAFSLLILSACTDNDRARNFGGTQQVNLPPGHKLVVATWKEANLWYLVRPMHEGEVAETWHFKEVSAWGALEGEVLFREMGGPAPAAK